MTMTAIELKELRGISMKTMITIVSATIIIVSSFVWGISDLKYQLRKIKEDWIEHTAYHELKFKLLDQKIDLINIQIEELKKQINETRNGK